MECVCPVSVKCCGWNMACPLVQSTSLGSGCSLCQEVRHEACAHQLNRHPASAGCSPSALTCRSDCSSLLCCL